MPINNSSYVLDWAFSFSPQVAPLFHDHRYIARFLNMLRFRFSWHYILLAVLALLIVHFMLQISPEMYIGKIMRRPYPTLNKEPTDNPKAAPGPGRYDSLP